MTKDESRRGPRVDAACTPDLYFSTSTASSPIAVNSTARARERRSSDRGDARAAIDALVAGKLLSSDQVPSIGCNIKWKT